MKPFPFDKNPCPSCGVDAQVCLDRIGSGKPGCCGLCIYADGQGKV